MARRQQSASRPELPSTPDSRKIDLTSFSRDRRSVMIQSKWCTVTATVCGVLAVASPAAAECAWVLWSQVHDPRPGAWQLQTAYPSVGACAKALDQREKEGRKAVYVTESGEKIKGLTERRAETDLYLRYGSDPSTGGIAWQCFPDTVDPRGSKAK
jgi:hypothetical protein